MNVETKPEREKSAAALPEMAQIRINEVLENTHASLKWSWQIVMGFALVEAVKLEYATIYDGGFLRTDAQFISFFLFCLVFMPVFFRFFYGDSRYLDLHYLELRLKRESAEYLSELKHKLSLTRRLVDILLLLTHGTIFIFLGQSLNQPDRFLAWYGTLMVSNCIWLAASVRMNVRVARKKELSVIDDPTSGQVRRETKILTEKTFPRRDDAPKFWICNNMICFLVLAIAWSCYQNAHLGRVGFLALCISVCIANSLADVIKMRHFYFPDWDSVVRGRHG
jgi:hypothetical protein